MYGVLRRESKANTQSREHGDGMSAGLVFLFALAGLTAVTALGGLAVLPARGTAVHANCCAEIAVPLRKLFRRRFFQTFSGAALMKQIIVSNAEL